MQDTPPPPQAPKSRGPRTESREERRKAALKANMARRKAQAKSRAAGGDENKDKGA